MTFVVGENVGPYRITDRLGQGGMATVFKAYHANLDRYVAIKVLHTAFKEDPNFLVRFQREAQIIAKLEHPSIVPVYDYNEHEGEPYLVMKFIEGETLKSRLQRKPFTLEETLQTMTAVAQALTYAHEQGVLHRDIKPSNILTDKNSTPYLADFGLARIASAGESTLSQDMMLGTPQYISPEQAQGVKDLTGTTDVYSLGVVLYELVVGRVPFNADTPYAIVHDHIYSPLPMPTKVNPQVPVAVERVLLKALAKDRHDRYTTPILMIEAFRDAVRISDMKELPTGSYRVAAGGQVPPVAPVVPGLPNAPQAPAVGISSPVAGSYSTPQAMSGVSVTGSSASERRERQRRRENLWLLGGFGLLVLTCLVGMFIALSTYAKANEAGLFVAAGGAVHPIQDNLTVLPPQRTSLEPTTNATTEASSAATEVTSSTKEAPTENSATIEAPTLIAEKATTTTASVAVQPSETPLPPTIAPTAVAQVPSHDQLSVMSIDAATQLVSSNPNDARARINLAIAYAGEKRLPKAVEEFQTGLKLIKGDGGFAMELARELIGINATGTETWPAFLYSYAYDAGHDKDAAIRAEAGKFLYETAKNANKRDAFTISRYAEYVRDSESAGLAAFISLAYYNAGLDSESNDAMYKATFINPDLPEVRLVRAIIAFQRGETSAAKADLKAAVLPADAPEWLLAEVQRLTSS
jgi:serine/threonine protein kinase